MTEADFVNKNRLTTLTSLGYYITIGPSGNGAEVHDVGSTMRNYWIILAEL